MAQTPEFSLLSSERIEQALSARIEALRLKRNITQQALAERAGISRSTLTRLVQDDKGISLDSFIRLLQALQLEERLADLIPPSEPGPLEKLAQQTQTTTRQRARPRTLDNGPWEWSTDDNAQ